MSLRINYNFQAEFTHVNLVKTERNLNTSLERLSTGYRINSAKDDAAGLFIADQLRLVSQALSQGSRNAQDGISAAQIAEGSLSQIYDKLTAMYTKAEQAANDTNDANARLALQEDIRKLVDAIDKISSTAEFNGLKLLDGSFTNKTIHFGPRADQTLGISIDSARAADLGAYVLQAPGNTATALDTFSNLLATNPDYVFASTETINVAGVQFTGYDGLTDAKSIANMINGNATLQQLGIEASAKNKSVADSVWSNIAVGASDTLTFNFYVGTDSTTPAFSISYGPGSTVTLQDLVDKINSEASANGANVKASIDNNKLVLETDGETVGLEVNLSTTATTSSTSDIDLGTLLQGATGVTLAGNSATSTASSSASAVKVGELSLISQDSFKYDFSGISAALGVTATGQSTLNNLNALNVTDTQGAELALKVIDATIKKVDKMRSYLGSIQINLQAIIDNNDFAATQTSEAESRIRNVDFAKEMANFTKQQTLMQSGMAMLAQANQLPQMVLQLLR